METFTERLDKAIDRVLINQKSKAWLLALVDLDELAKTLNAKIEAMTAKKLGMALRPVPAEEYNNLYPDSPLREHKFYKLVLIGEGRTKILMHIGCFGVRPDRRYPVLFMNEKLQVIGELDCREMLEAQFLTFVRHADSKFLSLVLSNVLVVTP